MTPDARAAAEARIIAAMVQAVNRNAQKIKPEPWTDVCARIAADWMLEGFYRGTRTVADRYAPEEYLWPHILPDAPGPVAEKP